MRGLVIWAAVLITAITGANAQNFLGFRLLDFDGRNIVWGASPGDGSLTVSYAFLAADTDFPDARNCRSMGPLTGLLARSRLDEREFRREVRAAFDMWEEVANIRFVESPDAAAAGILIGAQREPFGRAFANVSYRDSGDGQRRIIDRSLVCLNPEQSWKFGFDGNLNVYDVRYTVAHEIGHAIGLDHPSPTGQLMGYRYEEKFRRLQDGDIRGAVLLYGPHQRPAQEPSSVATRATERAIADP
jgi:hypothetical protein